MFLLKLFQKKKPVHTLSPNVSPHPTVQSRLFTPPAAVIPAVRGSRSQKNRTRREYLLISRRRRRNEMRETTRRAQGIYGR